MLESEGECLTGSRFFYVTGQWPVTSSTPLLPRYRRSILTPLVSPLGILINVSLDKTLPTFHQYVDRPTRDNTLDLLYANAQDAYSLTGPPRKICPQPGPADQSMTLLFSGSLSTLGV